MDIQQGDIYTCNFHHGEYHISEVTIIRVYTDWLMGEFTFKALFTDTMHSDTRSIKVEDLIEKIGVDPRHTKEQQELGYVKDHVKGLLDSYSRVCYHLRDIGNHELETQVRTEMDKLEAEYDKLYGEYYQAFVDYETYRTQKQDEDNHV